MYTKHNHGFDGLQRFIKVPRFRNINKSKDKHNTQTIVCKYVNICIEITSTETNADQWYCHT